MMPDQATRDHNRISGLGLIVLVMAMISLVVVLWTSYQDRVQTQCQKDLNARFLVVLQDRATIADGDREAVRSLVSGLVKAETEKETAAALLAYDNANTRLDQLRKEVKYPADTLCE